MHHHAHPLPRQRERDGAPHADGAARHQCRLAGKVHREMRSLEKRIEGSRKSLGRRAAEAAATTTESLANRARLRQRDLMIARPANSASRGDAGEGVREADLGPWL